MKDKEIDIVLETLGEIEGEHMIRCNVKDLVLDESVRRNVSYSVVRREYIAANPKMARWL